MGSNYLPALLYILVSFPSWRFFSSCTHFCFLTHFCPQRNAIIKKHKNFYRYNLLSKLWTKIPKQAVRLVLQSCSRKRHYTLTTSTGYIYTINLRTELRTVYWAGIYYQYPTHTYTINWQTVLYAAMHVAFVTPRVHNNVLLVTQHIMASSALA